ncbi:MAG: hypothetical protein U0R69_16265 [Gaiellales bacterium]
MRSEHDIRSELDVATDRRSELWAQLGGHRDSTTAAELARLNALIEGLWDELRTTRTRSRFGPVEAIVRRADRDRRLERDIDQRIANAGRAREAA